MLNLAIKCWNSISNAWISKKLVIIIVIHVAIVKMPKKKKRVKLRLPLN